MKFFEKSMKLFYILSRPLSGLMLHNSKRVRVLVVAEGKTLLQRSSFGHQKWSIPGGGIDKGETSVDAAKRELGEEVGIVVPGSQLKVLGELRLPVNKRWPMLNLTFFVVEFKKTQEPQITRRYEILDARWFQLENLPEDCSKTVHQALKLWKKQT